MSFISVVSCANLSVADNDRRLRVQRTPTADIRSRRQRVLGDELAERLADVEAVDVVELPVDAAIDAAHAGFLGRGPQAGERALHAGHAVGSRREAHRVATEGL